MSAVSALARAARRLQPLVYDDAFTVLTAQVVDGMGISQPDWSLPPVTVLVNGVPLTLKGSRQAVSERTAERAGLTGRSNVYSVSCELYDLNPQTHRLMDSALAVYAILEVREAKSHLEVLVELL